MSLKAVEEVASQVPADDFQALEDKVYRTIELYKAAREGKATAERDVQRLRQQLEEREEQSEQLRREMVQLRKDREEVRARAGLPRVCEAERAGLVDRYQQGEAPGRPRCGARRFVSIRSQSPH